MSARKDLIAMVDDDPAILKTGKNVLSEIYTVATFSSVKNLFAFLENNKPSLILLDVMMPETDGYEAIKILKAQEKTRDIPVIFLTGKTDSGDELAGLNLGAIDYITKPFVPALLLKRIEMHLLLKFQKQILETQSQELQYFNDNLQRMVEEKTHKVVTLQSAIITAMANLIEYRDSVTGGHDDRMQCWIGILIGELMKRSIYEQQTLGWDVELLQQSSQLHDVGKIAIRDSILKKPGPLDETEFAIMKKHTEFGVQIIERIKIAADDNGFLNYAKIFAAHHHERWDGTGYPQGLKGEEIPLLGRIMAIADVYDALISERSYKSPFTHDKTVSIILEGRGTQFDPDLIDIFVEAQDLFQG